MRAKEFLKQVHDGKIAEAIHEAELKTSGEIRVFISRKDIEDAVAAAQEHFIQLGMAKTRDRNGVLVFVAPHTQKFAIIGDAAVHAKCGDPFWKEVADAMSSHFQRSEFTEGILQGVARAGELLAKHFPRRPDDKNELPDRVAHD